MAQGDEYDVPGSLAVGAILHLNARLSPVRFRFPFPEPEYEIRRQWSPSQLTQLRDVLSPVVVAVHCSLREGLFQRKGGPRLGRSPRDFHDLLHPRFRHNVQECPERLVDFASEALELGVRPVILGLRPFEWLPRSPGHPEERGLRKMIMMLAVAYRDVLECGRERLQPFPEQRIRPRLV